MSLRGEARAAKSSDDQGEYEEEEGVAAHKLPLSIMVISLHRKKKTRGVYKYYLTCALKNFCREPKMRDFNFENLQE